MFQALVLAGAIVVVLLSFDTVRDSRLPAGEYFFLLLASAGSADELPPPTRTYVVDPGDTLWEIADALAAPGADIRDTVDSIMELNSFDGATIYPGQAILLPTQ